MTTFEGIVTLAEDRVPVTVGLDHERVTLISGDVQIGDWPVDECAITSKGDGTWAIEAEEDTISFLPNEPGRFELSLNEPESTSAPERKPARNATPVETKSHQIVEGPRPRSATLIGFYVLAGITAALGLWAIVSMFA